MVRSFITFYTLPNYALVVAPAAASTIHSVADLKGRRVGVSSPGSPTQMLMNYSLVSHGLSRADVSMVTISTGAASLAAIERGQVDAAAVVKSAVAVLEQRLPRPHDPGRRAYIGRHGGSFRIEDFSERVVDLERDLAESEPRHGQAARAGDVESDGVAGQPLRGRGPDADPRGAPFAGCGRRSASDPAGPTESVSRRRDAPDGLDTARRVLSASNDKARTGTFDTFRSSIRTNSCAGRESPTAPSVENPSAVELNDVAKRFAGYTAVEGITLDARAGTFVSMVGPSGCGKSTVLSLIAGLIAPTRGTVSIFGEPLAGLNRRAAYMFQQDALLPWKTVLEHPPRAGHSRPARRRGHEVRRRRGSNVSA